MTRNWRVVYQENKPSVLMTLEEAWNYLHIFSDAKYVTNGETKFDRRNPPGFFTWALSHFGLI